MLQFKELRITPDSKYLIIDVTVNEDDYYKDVVIDSIVIDTLETFRQGMPSNNPIYTYNVPEADYEKVYSLPEKCNCNPVLDDSFAYCFVDEKEKTKSVRLKLSAKELGATLNNNMFFVYAIAGGMPTSDTPCGMDTYIKLGTVVNLYPFYLSMMTYLSELNNCLIPKNLIDLFLRYKALELNVRTGNYVKAIDYYKLFFSELKITIPNKCGCNGRSN